MKRLGIALVALWLLAAPAFGDVTVTMSVSVNAGQRVANGSVVSSFKGAKARAETKMMDQDVTMLFDPAAKQWLRVNPATKQVEPVNPQLAAQAGMPVSLGDAKATATPTGQTKEILGRVCQGYDLVLTVPMVFGGETLTVKMTGLAWVTKEGPGVAEFMAAQKAMADAGLSVSTLAQGPQAKAMAELAKVISGLTMEQELRSTVEGTGQMAQMIAQAGSTTMTMKVTAISTDPLPDSAFAIPEGYTKK